MTKLVIILSHGTIPVAVKDEYAQDAIATVTYLIESCESEYVYLKDGDKVAAVFKRAAFLGCYLDNARDILKERTVEAIEKMAESTTEGDEWKDN